MHFFSGPRSGLRGPGEGGAVAYVIGDRAKPAGDVAVPAYRASGGTGPKPAAETRGGSVGSWPAMAGLSIEKETTVERAGTRRGRRRDVRQAVQRALRPWASSASPQSYYTRARGRLFACVCVALGDRPDIRHPPSRVGRSGFIFAPIRGERLALPVASEPARYDHADRSSTGDANNDDAADKHKRASRRLLEWHGRA